CSTAPPEPMSMRLRTVSPMCGESLWGPPPTTGWKLSLVSMRASWSSWKGWIDCGTASRSLFQVPPPPPPPAIAWNRANADHPLRARARPATHPESGHEQSFPPLYFATGSDFATDAELFSHRPDCLAIAASGGTAPGGLPHYSGIYLPTRRRAGSHCPHYHRPPGEAPRPDTWPQADVVHQLR